MLLKTLSWGGGVSERGEYSLAAIKHNVGIMSSSKQELEDFCLHLRPQIHDQTWDEYAMAMYQTVSPSGQQSLHKRCTAGAKPRSSTVITLTSGLVASNQDVNSGLQRARESLYLC